MFTQWNLVKVIKPLWTHGMIVFVLIYTPMFTMSAYAISAVAATNQNDLSVGLKTLPLLTNKITGTAVVAVVYDPANAPSKQEAEGIKSLLDSDMHVPGDVKLVVMLVPATDPAKIAGSRIAVLTDGLGTNFNAISTVAANNGVLTMSTDLSCVKSNKCVLGIVSSPSVEIYYSKQAAEAAKIQFVQTFTMLVKQVQGDS